MSRGGHNWNGGSTTCGTTSLDIMALSRARVLGTDNWSGWRWSRGGKEIASIRIIGGRDAIILTYRVKFRDGDWQDVTQRVPIEWLPCRFGGERPWFLCVVHTNGEYCGRRVAKLYGAGRLFACRYCYRLGYASQRGGRMDQAHHRLARLHAKLGADYDGPDGPPPPRPKWMRWQTYYRATQHIEAADDRVDFVFMVGAQRLFDSADRADRRRRSWR